MGKNNPVNQNVIKDVVKEILENIPYAPFLCLPLSAIFYAILKDKLGIESQLVTGDLSYKNQLIFKEDFKVEDCGDGQYREWAGHAWVGLDGWIYDLSLFRTLYSQEFRKPFKDELIETFGKGRGCLIARPQGMEDFGLSYKHKNQLNDDTATAIIRGYDRILRK